jgi:hypothetical protein
MKTMKFALLAVVLIVLASCEANTFDQIAVQTTNPTYELNVKPIMSSNCTNCHSSGGGQYPSLENYEEVKAAVENNNLIGQIEAPSGQGMPENQRMPQTKIDAIKTWMNNGFPN